MPLDGTGFKLPVEVEPFKGGREGLAQLSAALRREMPRGFRWDYGCYHEPDDCGTAGCALGLAATMWPKVFPTGDTYERWDQLVDAIGIEDWVMMDLFSGEAYPCDDSVVTPAMVADRIDHWLQTGEIK